MEFYKLPNVNLILGSCNRLENNYWSLSNTCVGKKISCLNTAPARLVHGQARKVMLFSHTVGVEFV
jgi:hypothetical protein